jgi:hypothetical protein
LYLKLKSKITMRITNFSFIKVDNCSVCQWKSLLDILNKELNCGFFLSPLHLLYWAIKLICNRAIHESENVCRYLNSTRQYTQRQTQVRSVKHINRNRHTDSNPWTTRPQINLTARYLSKKWSILYLRIYINTFMVLEKTIEFT